MSRTHWDEGPSVAVQWLSRVGAFAVARAGRGLARLGLCLTHVRQDEELTGLWFGCIPLGQGDRKGDLFPSVTLFITNKTEAFALNDAPRLHVRAACPVGRGAGGWGEGCAECSAAVLPPSVTWCTMDPIFNF